MSARAKGTGEVDRSASAEEPSSPRQGMGLVLLPLLLGLIFVTYQPALACGFAWLDQLEIVEGALVVRDVEGLLRLWSDDGNYAGYHRPLYNLMHSLDLALWGLEPWGFHLSSVVLHLLNTWLAFSLLVRTGLKRGVAIAIAALFGLHPVNTAVAGLIHSKADLLVTAALLGASILLVEGWRRSSRFRTVAAIVLFVLGAWSKETAFVLPILATLSVAFGFRPAGAQGSARGALLGLWGVAAALALHRFMLGTGTTEIARLGLVERLATFGTVYVGYLRRLCVPNELSVCDVTTAFSALSGTVQVRAGLRLLLALGLQVVAWRRFPRLRPWIALFNVSLLPVAQVVPILHFRADRFLYLPSLAFAGFLVEATRLWVSELGEPARSRAMRALPIAGLVFAGLFVARIRARLPEFRDDVTLFRPEVERTPDYREGLSILGRTLQREGRFDAAEPLLERALRETPGRISYVDVEGVIVARVHNLLALGRAHDAYDLARQAAESGRVTRIPTRAELDYNRAVAAFRLGRHDEAVAGFVAYRRGHPTDAGCLYLLGMSAKAAGDAALAEDALRSYLRHHPGAPDRGVVESALAELRGR